MTDLEITTLCAQAMGVPLMGSNVPLWNPLHDDAQAMALVKKFPHLCLPPLTDMVCDCVSRGLRTGIRYDLNRGICRAVAAMWAHSSDASKQDYERKFAAHGGDSK